MRFKLSRSQEPKPWLWMTVTCFWGCLYSEAHSQQHFLEQQQGPEAVGHWQTLELRLVKGSRELTVSMTTKWTWANTEVKEHYRACKRPVRSSVSKGRGWARVARRGFSDLWGNTTSGIPLSEAGVHVCTFLNTRLCSNTASWLEETLTQVHQEAGPSSLNQKASDCSACEQHPCWLDAS